MTLEELAVLEEGDQVRIQGKVKTIVACVKTNFEHQGMQTPVVQVICFARYGEGESLYITDATNIERIDSDE